MAASVAASLVFAYVCPPVTPPMRQTAHHRSCIVLNEGYEEAVSQADPNFPRPRRSGLKYSVADAPRTLEASELHAQLHGARPTGRAADDLQSEAFERGVLLGFALAQHLPAMPIPPDELLSPPEAKKGLSPCTIKVVGVGGGGGNTLNRVAGFDKGVAFAHVKSNQLAQEEPPGCRPVATGPDRPHAVARPLAITTPAGWRLSRRALLPGTCAN